MKKLSIDQIKSGVLVGKPEKITVTVKVHGEEHEFDSYITPFGYEAVIAQMRAFGEKKEALAGILASVMCDENGVLIFTEDDVRSKFNQPFIETMWAKVVEINMLGKKPTSTSKTSSSSKSASRQGGRTRKSNRSNTAKSKNTKPTSESMEASTLDDESSKK
ncbi:phage tail assembly chaperone family protein, TAC [Acinetobacter rudis]|uniref:phage tail assembly chaperone family protein, TAC n=1 Tax=Acinetobacter rudis TaxID=632955 RepID=UPI00280FFBCE|nr:phage tail assembly chaperone family protein, TAC [Acinetobacter rudis]MDQ8951941.1 phage tail assembly chaperone family protein, TAC [Acinetobacter rudis]